VGTILGASAAVRKDYLVIMNQTAGKPHSQSVDDRLDMGLGITGSSAHSLASFPSFIVIPRTPDTTACSTLTG